MRLALQFDSLQRRTAISLAAAGGGCLIAMALVFAASAPAKKGLPVLGAIAALGCYALLSRWPALLEQITLFALSATLALSIKVHLVYRAEHIGGAIGYRISITEVLAIVFLLVLWLSQTERRTWKISIDRPITLSFVAYFVFAAMSALAARDVELGLFQLSALVEAFVLFVLLSNVLLTRRRVTTFVTGLLVGLALQSGVALVQAKFPGRFNFEFAGGRQATEQLNESGNVDLPDVDLGTTMLQGDIVHRPTGLLIHPNVFGLYLVLTIPVAIAVLLSTRLRYYWVIAAGSLMLAFIALYLSLSRSAWAGTVVALTLCGIFGRRLRLRLSWQYRLVLLAALLAAGGIVLAKSATILDRLRGTASEAVDFRLTLDRAALAMLRDHPALGVGLNNFVDFVEQYDSTGMSHYIQFPVHTLYLLEASETGIAGGIAFLFFVGVTCVRGFQLARRAPLEEHRILGAFLVAGLVGFWFAELTGFVYRIPVMTSYVWCCLGLICALPRLESEPKG